MGRSFRLLMMFVLLAAAFVSLPAVNQQQTALAATVSGDCTVSQLETEITNAASGDTIDFDCNTTPATIDFSSRSDPFTIDKTLTIDGDNEVVFDGGESVNFFSIVSGGDLTLRNLVLQNGSAASGGAIHNIGGTLTVENSTLSQNQATDSGGAIVNINGSGTISDSTFDGNEAGASAGAIINDTQSGGESSLTISGSTFARNDAGSSGGAFFNNGGEIRAGNSTFFSNTSGVGGGSTIFVQGGSFLGFSSTFFSDASNAMIQVNADAAFTTSILEAPSGLDCGGVGTIASGGFNLTDDTSCGFDNTGDSQGDANLGGLADNGGPTETMLPIAPSDAIDAVPTTADFCDLGATISDQRGVTRPQLDGCDIGAVEVQLEEFPEQALCANRFNGDLRMPRTPRCSSTEVLLTLPDDGPLSLCVNRFNGDARFSRTGRCASTEFGVQVIGDKSLPVCVNRFNGDLRVPRRAGRCASTEVARLL